MEVDAYCLSKLAKYAIDAGFYTANTTASDASNALTHLNMALQAMEENEVFAEDEIIFVSPAFLNLLRNSTQITKFLTQEDYNKNIKFRIESYEGRPVVVVTPRRFHTGFKVFSGNAGGYYFESGSAPIDFMVVAKSAAMHIVKYDKVKVISGDLNLAGNGFDGYTIYARVYHDVFVPDNKIPGIYVKVNGTTETADTTRATLTLTADTAHKITAMSVKGGTGEVAWVKVATGTVSSGKLTGTITAIGIGDTATQGATYYAIDGDNNIVSNGVTPYPSV